MKLNARHGGPAGPPTPTQQGLGGLLLVGVLLFAGACSLLNREGPDVTCADLKNGAQNACADGIIATCPGGVVRFEVCSAKSVCGESWQTAGQFRCEQGSAAAIASSDGGGASVPGADAAVNPGSDASSGGGGCESCIQSKCSALLSKCQEDAACAPLYQCLIACSEKVCGDACLTKYSSAARDYPGYPLRDCVGGGGVGPGCKASCPAW